MVFVISGKAIATIAVLNIIKENVIDIDIMVKIFLAFMNRI